MARRDDRRLKVLGALCAAAAAGAAGLASLHLIGGGIASEEAPVPARVPTVPATAVVVMPTPALASTQAMVCAGLIAELPALVQGLPRRSMPSGDQQNAAYGEPPVTLACGGPVPVVGLADAVYVFNGVCWIQSPPGSWTTADRTVAVQVRIPDEHRPAHRTQASSTAEPTGRGLQGTLHEFAQAGAVTSLSETVRRTVPESADRPAGCRPQDH